MEKIELTALIGENVSKYRQKAGLTQAQLAEKAGVGISFISRVERGEKSMKLHTLYNLAEALGVSCDALLYPDSSSVHLSSIVHLLKGMPPSYLAGIEGLIRTCGAYFMAKDSQPPQEDREGASSNEK